MYTVRIDAIFFLLDDPSVDGVIIATVTYTHEELVKKCIKGKKAIFCEKPISENLKGTGNISFFYFQIVLFFVAINHS